MGNMTFGNIVKNENLYVFANLWSHLWYEGNKGKAKIPLSVAISICTIIFYLKKKSLGFTKGDLNIHTSEEDAFALANPLKPEHSLYDFAEKCVGYFTIWLYPPTYEHDFNFIRSAQFDSKDEYIAAFDYLVKAIYKSLYSDKYYSSIPETLVSLANELLPDSAKNVFNPFSGLGEFVNGLTKPKHFVCVDKNSDFKIINDMKSLIFGDDYSVEIYQNESDLQREEKFDAIVTIPPFGYKFQDPNSYKKNWIHAETFSLGIFEENTNEDGVLITFLPSSFFSSLEYEELRKKLAEKGYLDTIIVLPAKLLYNTNISIVCLVLSKRTKSVVKFVDATDCFVASVLSPINKLVAHLNVERVLKYCSIPVEKKSKFIPYSKIEDFGNWDALDYLYEDNVECPVGYELLRLSDISIDITADIMTYTKPFGLVINKESLFDNFIDYKVETKGLGQKGKKGDYYYINSSALLITPWPKFKVAYLNNESNRYYFIHKDIKAFEMTANVHMGYLCMTLLKNKEKIEHLYSHMYRHRFSDIKLALPQITSQQSIYEEARNLALISKAKEMGLQDAISTLKAQYMEEVRMRKHDMRPYLRELGSIERLIGKCLNRYNDIKEIRSTISDLLELHSQNLHKLTNLVDILTREDSFGKPEKLNINNNLLSYASQNEDVEVSYFVDITALRESGLISKGDSVEESEIIEELPLYVNIAPDDFQRLVGNILNNAKKHGFSSIQASDYHKSIRISLTIDMKAKMFQIDFCNNGIPFPEGLTKGKYGLLGNSEGPNKGDGNGGHIIKEIVNHYGGDYDVFMNNEWATVRILLPICLNDSEDDTI